MCLIPELNLLLLPHSWVYRLSCGYAIQLVVQMWVSSVAARCAASLQAAMLPGPERGPGWGRCPGSWPCLLRPAPFLLP